MYLDGPHSSSRSHSRMMLSDTACTLHTLHAHYIHYDWCSEKRYLCLCWEGDVQDKLGSAIKDM